MATIASALAADPSVGELAEALVVIVAENIREWWIWGGFGVKLKRCAR
jgi:hypothetical protein